MADTIRILFIGDVIGEPGYNYLKFVLPSLKEKLKTDFIIANGENITDGKGTLEKDANKLLELGIDMLTGGNHTMDKIQAHKFLNESDRVLRPYNYPKGAYGRGYGIYKCGGHKVAVINLMGRVFMKAIECPFRAFDRLYEQVKNETNIIFVDFHAEATAEKVAMGWHCEGRASVVVGTHTHVPSADLRILPGGTGYVTDVGMSGAYDSVIGMKKEAALKRFIFATPQKHEVADGDLRLAGVLAEIDTATGKTKQFKRILHPEF